MNIKLYFKQAWRMICQNRLFSAIYIGGTAIAIATTTVFAVIYYVKLAPIYPEYNRSRTSYVSNATVSDKERGSMWQGYIGYDLLTDYIYTLKSAECATGILNTSWDNNFVLASDGISTIEVNVKPTDPAFFKVYEYDFKEGAPFTDSDLSGGVRRAVITDAAARKIFGTDRGVTGKKFRLNYKEFEVAGVVRAGSTINKFSYGEIFTPYTTYPRYKDSNNTFMGGFVAVILSDNHEAVREEFLEKIRKFNTSQDVLNARFLSQPMNHTMQVFNNNLEEDFSIGKIIKDNLIILLVLLLVPALNLSGMISGRMEMRNAELGLRKSFGATRRTLLWQVVWENMLMTLIGGVIGLAISLTVIYASSGTVLTLLNTRGATMTVENTVTPDMMFSPWVFLISLGLCVVLNLLAALIPAWMGLRKPIVQSLKS